MEKVVAEEVKREEMLKDVLKGLEKPRKTIPSKYFYDKRGSELFEKICLLEEYYPTETEFGIMKNKMDD
ncbi:MAG: L-histidine N(alpha)-methyltransferase, partial [Balneolaceae bacterium]